MACVMGKISEILKEKNDQSCAFGKIIDLLDEEDSDAVIQAIVKKHSGYSISEALRAGNYKVAASTVTLHIKEGCVCYGRN